jgi:excisionase family DNA binding protein
MDKNTDHFPPLALSIEELCRATGLGRTTIYAEIAAGRLRAQKCRRRTVFRVADVEIWLATLPSMSSRNKRGSRSKSTPSVGAE